MAVRIVMIFDYLITISKLYHFLHPWSVQNIYLLHLKSTIIWHIREANPSSHYDWHYDCTDFFISQYKWNSVQFKQSFRIWENKSTTSLSVAQAQRINDYCRHSFYMYPTSPLNEKTGQYFNPLLFWLNVTFNSPQ